MSKITIAIDGFSSTGKSTVAKQLAKKLGYVYVDTGAMYRAITLYAMEKGLISEEKFHKNELIQHLPEIALEFKFNDKKGFSEIYLNGKNVENKIRSMAVSNLVSKVAEVSEVRKKLVEQQQQIGKNKGVVMDGRDIGTVVFPDAELKLFMTASAETRAERRYKELINSNNNVTFEEVLKNVKFRDHLDSTRDDSPLIMADDAIKIDNSNMTQEEQFDKILNLALQKINH
ncbi:(d)CMP kinase [Lutibacter sp.]